MPREGCIDGNGGGFYVSNFSHHDDVGGLAKHGTESGGKGHANVGVDRHLIHARQLILDGVFHCN